MAKFITTTLMDGYAGSPHITETQIGLANQAAFGPDDYVLGGGRESEAQVLTNNSIRIFDAVYCIQGRRDVIPASGYTDVTIANGTQGMNRNDIIVRRYKKDESSEIESMEYAVIKGTPNAGEALDPKVTTGDIRTGATLHEMKLYRVKIKGLNITAVEPLFNILKNMAVLQQEIAKTNKDLSKLLDYDPTEKTYFENGWTMKYRHISHNQVYVTLQNTNTGATGAIPNHLIMAGVPLQILFEQCIPVKMVVGSAIVGYGSITFSGKGAYLQSVAYGNSASWVGYGVVTVE